MGEARMPTNDRREIFGWAMYDWANSAFSTTVGTVFLGPYVATLASEAGKGYADGMARLAGIPIAPDSFFPYCVSISVALQVLFLPILGAIADYSHLRKRMLQVFATLGAALTILLFLVSDDRWWLGGLLFIGANLASERRLSSTTRIFPISPARTSGIACHRMVGPWDISATESCWRSIWRFLPSMKAWAFPRSWRSESTWRPPAFGGCYSHL